MTLDEQLIANMARVKHIRMGGNRDGVCPVSRYTPFWLDNGNEVRGTAHDTGMDIAHISLCSMCLS